jgi:hypothetical protein
MLMDWKLNVNFPFTYLLEIIFAEEIKISRLVELLMGARNAAAKGLKAYVN